MKKVQLTSPKRENLLLIARLISKNKACSQTISLIKSAKVKNAQLKMTLISNNSFNVTFAMMLITGFVLLLSKACHLFQLNLCVVPALTNLESIRGSSTIKYSRFKIHVRNASYNCHLKIT